MADYTIATTITAVPGSVVVDGAQAYEAIDAGSFIYRRSDGTWAKSRANNVATYACHGIALSTAAAAGQRFSVCTEGDIVVSGQTKGNELYVSHAVAGKAAPRADITTAGSNAYITYLGVFTSATNLRFRPHNSGAQVP